MITPRNLAFPFANRQATDISRAALLTMAASPFFGWLVFFVLALRLESADRLMMFLFIFPFGAHLLLPLLFHGQVEQRKFMREFPFRFYGIPVLLSVFMVWSSFYWIKPAAVLLALASGFHIGMQHYGLMRLIDRKLAIVDRTSSAKQAEKILFLISAMLPTAIFGLKILHRWEAGAATAALLLSAATGVALVIHTIKEFGRVPAFRLVALWSFALMAVPWAFYYRFDFNEGAFLVAGIGHSLQYFLCYRLFLSGKSSGPPHLTPDQRNLKSYYLIMFAALAAVEWAAFENIQRNFLSSLIWALSAVHIYYDSLFWKNGNDHMRAHVMAPLYKGLDRMRVK